jgi:hypothetical protein
VPTPLTPGETCLISAHDSSHEGALEISSTNVKTSPTGLAIWIEDSLRITWGKYYKTSSCQKVLPRNYPKGISSFSPALHDEGGLRWVTK